MIIGTEHRLVLILGIIILSVFKQETMRCNIGLLFLLGELIFLSDLEGFLNWIPKENPFHKYASRYR